MTPDGRVKLSQMVEAAGVEPASPNNLPEVPTCLVKRKSQRRKMPSDPHTSAQPAEIFSAPATPAPAATYTCYLRFIPSAGVRGETSRQT